MAPSLVADTHDSRDAHAPVKERKQLLKLSNADWRFAMAFLLSLSVLGLGFFPFALVVLAMMVNRLAKNRYDLVLMLMVMVSSRGFLDRNIIHVNLVDPLLLLSVIALFFYRQSPQVKQIFRLVVGYILFLVCVALISDEELSIQMFYWRQYSCIIAFIVPMWIFANRGFDIQYFFRKAISYFLIICAMYVLDEFIFNGWMLIPADSGIRGVVDYPSTWTYIVIRPLHFQLFRKYPEAMYIICIVAYPLGRYYRIKWWQWALVLGAFFAIRTMTVIMAFLISYVLSQGKVTKVMRYVVGGAMLLWIAYLGDAAAGSPFRLAHTIDQFVELGNVRDREDLSQFGTGRMIQIIPKWEALVEQNCEWLGFGFIHPTKSTNPRYQIYNDLKIDISEAEESVAITENAWFNTILHTGIIGLLMQTLFLLAIYFKLRHERDSRFYLNTFIFCTIAGVGGYASINGVDGLLWVATALAAILLTARTTPAQKALTDN